MHHTSQNFAFVYFYEENLLIFHSPVAEPNKAYSSDSLVTTILEPFLANFIPRKEEVAF
jgi:hypothetical protein